MRTTLLCMILLLSGMSSYGQSDIQLIAFPHLNSSDTVISSEITPIATVDERGGGQDFEMAETVNSLRYSISHSRKRDIYFNVDSYWASMESGVRFDESGELLPDELYDIGVGGMYRKQLKSGKSIAGTLRVGSASNKLFDSADELYLRSLLVLRTPTGPVLDQKSWVFLTVIDSELEIPVIPGIGYVRPFGERSIALIGFPLIAVGGELSQKLNYFVTFYPMFNLDGRLNYEVSDNVTAYTGIRAQARYFNRAKRDNDDDKIRMRDTRVFIGASMKAFKQLQLDAKVGYIFAREFGEGDDAKERDDNNIRLDNALFASGSARLNF